MAPSVQRLVPARHHKKVSHEGPQNIRAIPSLQAIHDNFGCLIEVWENTNATSDEGMRRAEGSANLIRRRNPGFASGSPNIEGWLALDVLLRPYKDLVTNGTADVSSAEEENGAALTEVARCRDWLNAIREVEEAHVELLVDECVDRERIMTECSKEEDGLHCVLERIRRMYVSPETKAAILKLEREEAQRRSDITMREYDGFCHWVAHMMPQWLLAAQEREKQRVAKMTAMNAAQKALEAELLGQRVSPPPPPPPPSGATAPMFSLIRSDRPPCSNAVAEGGEDESGDNAYAALRRRAIEMLSREEEIIRTRRTRQLEVLRQEEENIRATMQQREVAARHYEWSERYASVLEREREVRQRMEERERLTQIRREERKILIEHLKAEEELLLARLKKHEERRVAEEAAAKQREALEKQKRAEMLRVEEELLQRRLQEHQHLKYVQALAAAQAKEYQEAEARKIREMRLAEEEEARAVARSREMLRQQEEELERRRRVRLEQEVSRPPPPGLMGLPPSLYSSSAALAPPYGGLPAPGAPFTAAYADPNSNLPHDDATRRNAFLPSCLMDGRHYY